MIPRYFARDHFAPPLTRTRIYVEDGKKILHLEIKINRSRYDGQMDYALSAMASVCRYAKRPFQKFVLIMEPDTRNSDMELVEAKAKCTIDYFVFKRVKYERWNTQCVSLSNI